jgi:hypothetical protein
VEKLTLVHDLAKSICSCPEVKNALNDKSHPCYGVVAEQNLFIENYEEKRQRPEPWIGRIGSDKVLFISSNPGISLDPGTEREDFPTYAKNPDEAADFFVERFNQGNSPVHATFQHPSEPDFLVRCIDGEYRSGMKRQKQSQQTWQGIHNHAEDLIGAGCDPDKNYALTEIVHCKSKDAKGVEKASKKCSDTWLPKILDLSTSNVVLLTGTKVRNNFAIPELGFPSEFGSGKNYTNITQKERSLRDIRVSTFGGRLRLYVFIFHPTYAVSPNRLEDIYGLNVLIWIRRIVAGEEVVPEGDEALKKVLLGCFS